MTGLVRSLAAFGLGIVLAVTASAGTAPAASMTDAQLVAARVAALKEDGQILTGAKNLKGPAAVQAAKGISKWDIDGAGIALLSGMPQSPLCKFPTS